MNKKFELNKYFISIFESVNFKGAFAYTLLITNQLLYQLSYKGSKKKLIYNAKMNCNRFVLALFLCPKYKDSSKNKQKVISFL